MSRIENLYGHSCASPPRRRKGVQLATSRRSPNSSSSCPGEDCPLFVKVSHIELFIGESGLILQVYRVAHELGKQPNAAAACLAA